MLSKVEIVSKIIPKWSEIDDEEVYTCMDIFAKQEAIAFKEWQDENLEDLSWQQYDGPDTWYNPSTRQVFSTEQLYDIFLSQKRK